MQRALSGAGACCSRPGMQVGSAASRGRQAVIARAKWQPATSEEADDIDVEQYIRKSSKAKREERKKAKLGDESKPFTVDSPIRAKMESGELSAYDLTEGRFLSALVLIFVALLLEGLLVGGSGFLPEAADQFVQDYIYTAFTPTVGLFLACSTAYGLWKTRNEPKAEKN